MGRRVEEEDFTFADALLVGCMMNTLLNHADTVKIACLAQLVNALAAIMTEPGGKAWAQTIYYPFALASRHGRGTALRPRVDCPSYACAVSDTVPYLDVSAVLADDGSTVTVFAVNRNLQEALECDISLPENARLVRHVVLGGHLLDAVNSAQSAPVQPREQTVPVSGPVILPSASWNMLQFTLA